MIERHDGASSALNGASSPISIFPTGTEETGPEIFAGQPAVQADFRLIDPGIRPKDFWNFVQCTEPGSESRILNSSNQVCRVWKPGTDYILMDGGKFHDSH